MKSAPKKKLPKVHPFPEDMGVTDDTYAAYVKEHNQKLRRLRREQTGLNMVEPE